MLDSIYVTMSVSRRLYPNLDLYNANKLHYTTLHYTSIKQEHIHTYLFI